RRHLAGYELHWLDHRTRQHAACGHRASGRPGTVQCIARHGRRRTIEPTAAPPKRGLRPALFFWHLAEGGRSAPPLRGTQSVGRASHGMFVTLGPGGAMQLAVVVPQLWLSLAFTS